MILEEPRRGFGWISSPRAYFIAVTIV